MPGLSQKKRSAYAILGLHKGANEDQVKHAYVLLVKKFDPEQHTDRFMIIQNAFDRLKDPERRAQEDVLTFNHIRGDFMYSKDERVDAPDAKLNQAIQALEERRAKDPSAAQEFAAKLIQGYLIRSWKNHQKNLLKEAIDDWMRVMEIDPTHQRAKNNLLCAFIRLGYAYANHELYDEAIELWDKAAQMDPDNGLIVHNLALAFEFSGRREQARRYWDETLIRWKTLLDRTPDDEALRNCTIEAHRHLADWGEGAPAGAPQNQRQQPSAGGSPSAPDARPSPQTTGPKESVPTDELQRCQEILKLKPDDFEASFRMGQILMEQKRWNEASQHMSALQKKNPRNIDLLSNLAWTQLSNQQVDLAFKTWKKALKLDPKNFSVREALIKAHMMIGKALREKKLFIRSLVHFKELTKYMPDSDEIHYELGRTYQMKGDVNSAYGEFQKVIKINPKHKQARIALSELKLRRA